MKYEIGSLFAYGYVHGQGDIIGMLMAVAVIAFLYTLASKV